MGYPVKLGTWHQCKIFVATSSSRVCRHWVRFDNIPSECNNLRNTCPVSSMDSIGRTTNSLYELFYQAIVPVFDPWARFNAFLGTWRVFTRNGSDESALPLPCDEEERPRATSGCGIFEDRLRQFAPRTTQTLAEEKRWKFERVTMEGGTKLENDSSVRFFFIFREIREKINRRYRIAHV